jgi:glycosyltransferase involved in cell wall biosynthesis
MGGSGVQRPLKFAKYLRDYGWNPIILCPQPGVYHTFDESLQDELEGLELEVHRVNAGGLFQKAAGNQTEKKVSVSDDWAKTLRRISRLFFYPDNKIGWTKPALKKALTLIKENHIEAIFSTAPPFSNHLLASSIKEATGLPLVVDYRDSWTNNHFQTEMWDWQKSILRNQERGVVSTADQIICLDAFMRSELISSYPDVGDRIGIIPHGFDPEDFKANYVDSDFRYKSGALNILYSGLFYEQNQPDTFLKAIVAIVNIRPETRDKIRLHFQGGLDARIKKLMGELNLDSMIEDYGYVTHQKAALHLNNADVLWMISNFDKELKQIKSGKLFEYIGTGKPILGLVHPSEATEVLLKYGAGFSAAPDNISSISRAVETIYDQWESDTLPSANEEFIREHNRKLLTEKLAQIFNVIS